MKVHFDCNHDSFFISTDSEFAAGVIAGIVSQHAHGGGWMLENVMKNEDGMWEIFEKHTDGGKSLANALMGARRDLHNLRDVESTRSQEFVDEVNKRWKRNEFSY